MICPISVNNSTHVIVMEEIYFFIFMEEIYFFTVNRYKPILFKLVLCSPCFYYSVMGLLRVSVLLQRKRVCSVGVVT